MSSQPHGRSKPWKQQRKGHVCGTSSRITAPTRSARTYTPLFSLDKSSSGNPLRKSGKRQEATNVLFVKSLVPCVPQVLFTSSFHFQPEHVVALSRHRRKKSRCNYLLWLWKPNAGSNRNLFAIRWSLQKIFCDTRTQLSVRLQTT